MPPLANAGSAPAVIEYADIPHGPIMLNGTASAPGAGASSITEWSWTAVSTPTGFTGIITGATGATPSISAMNVSGVLRMFLAVKNNLGQWSETNPARAAVTNPNAFVDIVAKLANSDLVLTPYGLRQWFEKAGHYWDLVRKVDDIQAQVTALGGIVTFDPFYVDNMYELTPAHGIDVHNDLNVNADLTITNGTLTFGVSSAIDATAASPSLFGTINVTNAAVSNDLEVGADFTVHGDAGIDGLLIAPTIQTGVLTENVIGAGILIDGITVKDNSLISSPGQDVTLQGSILSPSYLIVGHGSGSWVTVRGNGSLTPDLVTDWIGPDSGAYVRIEEVQIEDDIVRLNHLNEKTPANGVYVDADSVLIKDGKVYADNVPLEIGGGAESSVSNVAVPTAFATKTADQTFAEDDCFEVRVEFDSTVAGTDGCDLCLYASPTADLAADGTPVMVVTIDATRSGVMLGHVRVKSLGALLAYDMLTQLSDGGASPDEVHSKLNLALAYAQTHAFFGLVLAPIGSWGPSSSITVSKLKMYRLRGTLA